MFEKQVARDAFIDFVLTLNPECNILKKDNHKLSCMKGDISMFCEKCGKMLEDGQTKCPICDAPEPKVNANTEIPATKEVVMESAPVEEPTVSEKAPEGKLCPKCGKINDTASRFCEVCGTPLVTEEAPKQPEATQEPVCAPQKAPKQPMKKSTKMIICAVLALIVAGVGTICFAHWDYVKNAVTKLFTSPEQYLATVVNDNIDDMTGDIASALAKAGKQWSDGYSETAKLEITVGDQLAPMVEEFSGEDIAPYIDWLDNISVVMKADMKDSTVGLDQQYKINGVNLLELDYLVDYDRLTYYIGFPNYNSTYLKMVATTDDYSMQALEDSYAQMAEILECIPEEETTQRILSRYVKCVMTNLGSVSETETTLTVEDIAQDVTVLTAEVSERDLLQLCKVLISTLKDDGDLEQIVNDIESMTDLSYRDFKKAMEDALEELNQVESTSDETLFTYKLYVDAKGKPVGMAIEAAGTELEYYQVLAGSHTGTMLICKVPGGVNVEWSGTGNSGSGTYALKVMNMTVVECETENISKDYKNGTVTLFLNEEFASMTEMEALSDIKLKLSWNMISETEGTSSIGLYYQDGLCLDITASEQINETVDIDIPENSLTVDMMYPDEEKMTEWMAAFDMEALFSNLRRAGLPEEIVGMMEEEYNNAINPEEPLSYEEWLLTLPEEDLELYTEEELLELYLIYLEQYALEPSVTDEPVTELP